MAKPIIINIRWADNTATLKKNLAEGATSIEAMKTSTEKLVAGLNGDKIVAQSQRWIAAVTQIGGSMNALDGVAKLTGSELVRFNSILADSIEKQKRMGQPINETTQALKAHTDEVLKAEKGHSLLSQILRLNIPLLGGLHLNVAENVKEMGAFGAAIGGVIVGLGIGFEVLKHASEAFVKIGEDAKALRNLSTETGIAAPQLMALSAVFRQFGVDQEALGRGIYQLSRRIAGDDTSAESAFEHLGISMQDLKSKSPVDQFMETIQALQGVANESVRSALAAELFGARMGQKFLSAKGNLRELVEEAIRSGEVMSNEATKGAADFAIALEKLENTLKATMGEALAPLMENIAGLIELSKTPIVFTIKIASAGIGALVGSAFKRNSGWELELIKRLFGGGGGEEEGPGPGEGGEHPGDVGPNPAMAGEAGAAAMRSTVLKQAKSDIVELTAAQQNWLASLTAIRTVTKTDLLGSGISEKQLERWKMMLNLQSEVRKSRLEAAKDNATADAIEEGQSQSTMAARLAALDAEHDARVKDIKATVELGAKKAADLLAEDTKYQAKRRLIEVEGNEAVNRALNEAQKETAKATERNRTKTLDEQLAAIDEEVYAKQQATLKELGYSEKEWEVEYEQWKTGEARKQSLRDEAGKKEADAERKLRAEIAGIQEQSDLAGLARTLASLDAKRQVEEAEFEKLAKEASLNEEQKQAHLLLIRVKYDALSLNARLDAARKEQKEILALDQQTEDLEIRMSMSGMAAELAIAKTKFDRKMAQLELEDQATEARVYHETMLYEKQKANIIAGFDPIQKAWLHLNDDIRQTWADTWKDAIEGKNGPKGLVDALLSPFKQIEQAWLKLLAAMVADWEGQLLAKIGIQLPGVGNVSGMGGGGPMGGGGGGMAGGLSTFTGLGAKMMGRGGSKSSIWDTYGTGWSYDEKGVARGAEGEEIDVSGPASSGGRSAASTVGGAVMAAQGIYSMFKGPQTKAALAMAGMEAGAGIGTMIMPGIGTAIGAGAGALVGFLKALMGKHQVQDIARDAGSKFGQEWSEDLQKTIGKNADKLHDEVAGELASLPDIIKEHPIDASNIEMYTGKVHDLFSMIDTGKMTIADVSKELDEVFPQMVAASTDAYGLITDHLKEIIRLDREVGTRSKEITKFLQDQASQVSGGLNEISAGTVGVMNDSLQKMLDSGDKLVTLTEQQNKIQASINDMQAKGGPKNEKQKVQLDTWKRQLADVQTQITEQARINAAGVISSQDAAGPKGKEIFDRVSRLTSTAFTAALASGKSFADAINEIGPTLDNLTLAQQKFGFASSDTLNKLLGFRRFAQENKEVIATLDGVNKMMSSLQNMGMLTQQDFDDLNKTASETYDKMIAGGVDSNTALVAMQPTLQRIWEIQQATGMTVDDNTQKLLDNAKTQGIVGEQARSVQEQTLDVLKAIATALGVTLPDAAKKGVSDVNKELSKVKAPDVKFPTVKIPYEYEQHGPGPGQGGPPGNTGVNNPEPPAPPSTGAHGGFVTPYGIVPQYLAMGGGVDWRPRGSDTVPAMLTPGEFVESASYRGDLAKGLQQVGDGLRALASAVMAIAGRDVVVSVDGQEIVRQTHKVWDQNINGLRTDAKQILGVT